MCTALVVREDYWRDYLWRETQLRGINVIRIQYVKMHKYLVEVAENAAEVTKKVLDAFKEAMNEVFIIVRDNLLDLINKITSFVDVLELEPFDDFGTVYDKIEARAVYLNRKESIRREQYYHDCFKLVKINYNIQHHDRRC